MDQQRAVLRLAATAGEILLENGAEIFRVQETIAFILDSFSVKGYSHYVLSNGIFIVLEGDAPDNISALRYVPVASVHLGRIAAVNDLSRTIAQHPDAQKLDDYMRQLETCRNIPPFPLWLQTLASGVGSLGFCYLLGGGILESIAAFFCGLVLRIFLSHYGKIKRSRFMHTILGAGLVSSLAVGLAYLLPFLSLDFIIIGAIIPLVPGVALTTAIRDFFNGDFLSGIIHMTEAALIGVCIAVGVGAALTTWPFLGGIVL